MGASRLATGGVRTTQTSRSSKWAAAVFCLISTGSLLAPAFDAMALPPRLYRTPSHQSPVRVEPDELLLLPGAGFHPADVVVYRRLVDTTLPILPPSLVPVSSTPNFGIAPVVRRTDEALTVRWPASLVSRQSYAVWVRNSAGEWSEPVRLNDARPLWVSPAIVHQTATIGSLPRVLKIVGRNLDAAPGAVTRVRLLGPGTHVLQAANDLDPSTAIEHHVALVRLPPSLGPGTYQVAVSRDGVSWVDLGGEVLTVLSDPVAAPSFPASSYGGCQADDGIDDTVCVRAAVGAAALAGGGRVTFSPGRWDLIGDGLLDPSHGIVLPVGVGIECSGSWSTSIVRAATWSAPAVFTLQGANVVTGCTFEDAAQYTATSPGSSFLQLGKLAYDPSPGPSPVDGVRIDANVFARPWAAIRDGGLPIHHLSVSANLIGAFAVGIFLDGLPGFPFRVTDSVISNNVFAPGGYVDVPSHAGAIATAIGASSRVEFTSNVADGNAATYLDGGPPGFRAAFFWHMRGAHDRLLVAQNVATCTGDKAGDGEAIAYDGNQNVLGLTQAEVVQSATPASVTVGVSIAPISASEDWVGQYVQIADGPGLGQSRRIASYAPAGASTSVQVDPGWDVPPVPGESKVVLTRAYWQIQTVDNIVDLRGCTKANPNGPSGGGIGQAGPLVDASFDGNRQYETDGISLSGSYSTAALTDGIGAYWASAYFVEIRNNEIQGEYDWESLCSLSGIGLYYSAGFDQPSPIVQFGVNVAGNTVTQADGLRGGAIVLSRGWWGPPTPVLLKSPLIQRNRIEHVSGPSLAGVGCPDSAIDRIGIHVSEPFVEDAVLYRNEFDDVTRPIVDQGTATFIVP